MTLFKLQSISSISQSLPLKTAPRLEVSQGGLRLRLGPDHVTKSLDPPG